MRWMMAAPMLAAAAWAGGAMAQQPATPGGQDALDLLTRGIAFATVEGRGQVPAYAAFLKERLVAQGFAPADITFVPMGETGYLTARWPGRDRAAKPILLLGHMDVVEARREDWKRDPFTAAVADGFVFGRGAMDNKADVSMMIAALGRLRSAGWTPARDLVLALSGDEETQMATTAAMAKAVQGAELALNGDGGGGLLDDAGKPVIYGLSAAEKTYADYVLAVTDPGGHSSRPGPVNAIYRLNAGLAKLAAHRFPVQISPVTRAYFLASAPNVPAQTAAAMRAFAEGDKAAAEVLARDPEYVGQVRTTCVATMIAGGHAPNALPQRAEATVNCRIFPGTTINAMKGELARIMGDPGITVTYRPAGTFEAPESPLRADLMAAVRAAVSERAPGVPIVPSMEAGASDSMHLRRVGVPTYGVGSVFMKSADMLAHGLDERLPLAALDAGVRHWETMLRTLAR